MARVAELFNATGADLGEELACWWYDGNESAGGRTGSASSSPAHLTLPEYRWTTQKVFHLMNFTVNGVRAVVFGFHRQIYFLKPKVLSLVLLDLPGTMFLSTYTLLVLFWAEIYHQVCIWIYMWINDTAVVDSIGNVYIAVISFVAALGFILYGGRLLFMLRRFPIESKECQKKLHEVGSVTAICFTCFLIRCVVVSALAKLFLHLSAFDADASLEVMDHPILNLIYYMLAVLPSALVLYILWKLPPREYQLITIQYVSQWPLPASSNTQISQCD